MADKPADAKPADAASSGVAFPTSDLPGTANPEPGKTDQQGVKGLEPASKTGTQGESEAPPKPAA